MLLGSADSEQPKLSNREIILEEFQPLWSHSINAIQTDVALLRSAVKTTLLGPTFDNALLQNKQLDSI